MARNGSVNSGNHVVVPCGDGAAAIEVKAVRKSANGLNRTLSVENGKSLSITLDEPRVNKKSLCDRICGLWIIRKIINFLKGVFCSRKVIDSAVGKNGETVTSAFGKNVQTVAPAAGKDGETVASAADKDDETAVSVVDEDVEMVTSAAGRDGETVAPAAGKDDETAVSVVDEDVEMVTSAAGKDGETVAPAAGKDDETAVSVVDEDVETVALSVVWGDENRDGSLVADLLLDEVIDLSKHIPAKDSPPDEWKRVEASIADLMYRLQQLKDECDSKVRKGSVDLNKKTEKVDRYIGYLLLHMDGIRTQDGCVCHNRGHHVDEIRRHYDAARAVLKGEALNGDNRRLASIYEDCIRTIDSCNEHYNNGAAIDFESIDTMMMAVQRFPARVFLLLNRIGMVGVYQNELEWRARCTVPNALCLKSA